jgi:hypothetical protein
LAAVVRSTVYNSNSKIKIIAFPCEVSVEMKYIIVTGGVVSGLGKGITISSIGR